MNGEPQLEPLADTAFAADEIARLLPRLRPIRDALERMNRYHARIKRLRHALQLIAEGGDDPAATAQIYLQADDEAKK